MIQNWAFVIYSSSESLTLSSSHQCFSGRHTMILAGGAGRGPSKNKIWLAGQAGTADQPPIPYFILQCVHFKSKISNIFSCLGFHPPNGSVAILAQVGRLVRLGHCLRGLLGPNHFALCPGALGFAFVLFLLRGDRSSSGPLDGVSRQLTHYRRNAPYNRHWWCIHSTRQSFGRQDVDTGCGFIFGTTSRNTSLTLCQTGWIKAEFFLLLHIFA